MKSLSESEIENGRAGKLNSRLTITDVAEKIGVTPKTIIRWEKAGKINKPKRDWKGWRIYEADDLAHIERIVSTVYEI